MSDLRLELADLEDLDRLAEVDRDAFYPNEHPFIECMYQHRQTPAGLQNQINMWRAAHGKTPNQRHFKVVDTRTGDIILSAKALVPCNGDALEKLVQVPQAKGPFWDAEDDRVWAEWVLEGYTQRRRDAFKKADGQVFAITHMAVDPKHQRRGAGSLFVQWLTKQADKGGLESVVEAGLRAELFYARHGFVRIEKCAFPPPHGVEKWKDKDVQEYIWMVRPPKRS